MALQYSTRDGDTADYIAWKHYGTTERLVVEQLLDANKGLADMGPLLPAGVIVTLPDIDTTEKATGVTLWT
ncbi:tail protein X [Tardiphaga sp. 20_F10_N6_6]|uniref:tail protein X n=1 Tax=Tardiphaga sp. 20_F10_N6_6 TaxID=3240788 RepID=UPI003F8C6D7C